MAGWRIRKKIARRGGARQYPEAWLRHWMRVMKPFDHTGLRSLHPRAKKRWTYSSRFVGEIGRWEGVRFVGD